MRKRIWLGLVLVVFLQSGHAQCVLELRYPDGPPVHYALKFPSRLTVPADSNGRVDFSTLSLTAADSCACAFVFSEEIFLLYDNHVYKTAYGSRSDTHLDFSFKPSCLLRATGLQEYFLHRKILGLDDMN